ncbi:hypothetical protein [Streptomyces sp. URMC 129]|uniref:hypothetical protein n=1 Tax=Streptomyces sp. URMC 129 TaxID=3423407 RepID=UPI003F1BF971
MHAAPTDTAEDSSAAKGGLKYEDAGNLAEGLGGLRKMVGEIDWATVRKVTVREIASKRKFLVWQHSVTTQLCSSGAIILRATRLASTLRFPPSS